jgi:hypothetical protein
MLQALLVFRLQAWNDLSWTSGSFYGRGSSQHLHQHFIHARGDTARHLTSGCLDYY